MNIRRFAMRLAVLGEYITREHNEPGCSNLQFGKGAYGAWLELGEPLADEYLQALKGGEVDKDFLKALGILSVLGEYITREHNEPGSSNLKFGKGAYGAWLELGVPLMDKAAAAVASAAG